MSKPIYALSIGLGVQSSTVKEIADRGGLTNKPSVCVFADTKQEPQEVYAWKEKLVSDGGIPIVTVSKGDLGQEALVIKRSKKTGNLWMKGLIPAYVLNQDGTKGLLGRKCTEDFKITPIQAYYRTLVGKEAMSKWRKQHDYELKAIGDFQNEARQCRKEKRALPSFPYKEFVKCQEDALVVQQIGISADEAGRAKDSQVPWIRSEWPLLEMNMSREDCLAFMIQKTNSTPPRSACRFCPFHSDYEWLRLKKETPEEFELAAKFEDDLRDAATRQEALKGIPFLHESCKPIREVVFNSGPSHKQLELFGNQCGGMCGV